MVVYLAMAKVKGPPNEARPSDRFELGGKNAKTAKMSVAARTQKRPKCSVAAFALQLQLSLCNFTLGFELWINID